MVSMNMAARNHCSRSIARGLHGHNGCSETSPKALSRLNSQVEDSEKFGLTRTPVGLGGTHPSGPGTKQRMLGNPLPIMMYHTTALPTGLPAFTITASSGTSHHRP